MAEGELRLRMKKSTSRMPEPDADYSGYLRENRQNQFVLAIAYPILKGLGKAEESQRMETESVNWVTVLGPTVLGQLAPKIRL